MSGVWDCIVVGGGAAGLSAALVLGRARQHTLVIDAGHQSNLAADGIGGLVGLDGVAPSDLYTAGRRELSRYPSVEVRDGEVVAGTRHPGAIQLDLADGTRERARRVLLATGMDYEGPAVAGVEQRWGRSVFHCPFCHGWEVRDRRLGVLGAGPDAVRRALLLREWSETITLYTNGPAGLDQPDLGRLRAAGVDLEERPVVGLLGPASELTAIQLSDGAERECHGLLIPVLLKQRAPLAATLGVALADPSPLALDQVIVDASFRTTVPVIYAAGDNATLPSVANAIASGSTAAAMIVHDLVADRHGQAQAAS